MLQKSTFPVHLQKFIIIKIEKKYSYSTKGVNDPELVKVYWSGSTTDERATWKLNNSLDIFFFDDSALVILTDTLLSLFSTQCPVKVSSSSSKSPFSVNGRHPLGYEWAETTFNKYPRPK